MRGKQIMTVTGPVNANLLGTVYSHEHLIVQPQIPDEKYIAYTLSDENASAKEVKLFANAGGKTIVEMTPMNCGKNRNLCYLLYRVSQGIIYAVMV